MMTLTKTPVSNSRRQQQLVLAVARVTGETDETIVNRGFTELFPPDRADENWEDAKHTVLVSKITRGISSEVVDSSETVFRGECWNCNNTCKTTEPTEQCPTCKERTIDWAPVDEVVV